MKLLIQATDEQHELIQKLLRSQKRASVEQMMVHVVQAYLVEMFRSTAADLSISCGDLAVAIQLYSIGIAGILLQYSGRRDRDADQLAAQLCRLLSGHCLRQP